jgi:hAT family C-terminal dimerisation region
MATSSASSERNFSTFGFVHSKLRNSLGPEKVKKLVYIKTNSRAFSDSIAVEESGSEDDKTSGSGSV